MRIDHIKLGDLHENDYLTTKEVAAIFGLSPRAIINWRTKKGSWGKNLRCKKFGYRTIRYQVKDIREFINKQ